MARRAIKDIPPNRVGEVVQLFVDDGVSRLQVIEEPDGQFTVLPASAVDAISLKASRRFAKAAP